jgi:hypothetical protein
MVNASYKTSKTKMTSIIPPHYRDSNTWEKLPESENIRLQGTLQNHLRKMGIKKSKTERIDFVKNLLSRQNNTCAFGSSVNGTYCWNEPKENYSKDKYVEKKYIKLQWGHIKPRCRNETQTECDLYLLCARCNNQIQTSRHIHQLKAELLSKLEHIDNIIKSTTST